jgi:hypothetical protein
MTKTTTYPPLVAITIRGGLIEDIDSTTPVRVVVEDWDVPDWDTGEKPTRSIYLLDGEFSGVNAEKLLRVLASE